MVLDLNNSCCLIWLDTIECSVSPEPECTPPPCPECMYVALCRERVYSSVTEPFLNNDDIFYPIPEQGPEYVSVAGYNGSACASNASSIGLIVYRHVDARGCGETPPESESDPVQWQAYYERYRIVSDCSECTDIGEPDEYCSEGYVQAEIVSFILNSNMLECFGECPKCCTAEDAGPCECLTRIASEG